MDLPVRSVSSPQGAKLLVNIFPCILGIGLQMNSLQAGHVGYPRQQMVQSSNDQCLHDPMLERDMQVIK